MNEIHAVILGVLQGAGEFLPISSSAHLALAPYLFGWHYQGHQQNPPAVIGQITLRWVYDVIMPREIIEEIRNRKRLSDKAHQWLSEGGLALLEKQIHAVTMIARSSMTYRDFDTRCATAFGSQPLQMTLFIGALEGGQ